VAGLQCQLAWPTFCDVRLSDHVILVDLNSALLASRAVRVRADGVGELSLAAPCMRLLRQGRFYAVSGAWEIAVLGLGLPLKPVRMGIDGASGRAGRQCTAWRELVLRCAARLGLGAVGRVWFMMATLYAGGGSGEGKWQPNGARTLQRPVRPSCLPNPVSIALNTGRHAANCCICYPGCTW